jgi:acyl carrier protein
MKEALRQYIIDKCLYGEGELDDDALLFEEGIMDSIGLVKMLNFIEETFNISFEMSDVTVENFSSLAMIMETLESKLEN